MKIVQPIDNVMTRLTLDHMDLSPKARRIIDGTDINSMYDLFGGMETPEEVEDFIDSYFEED